jgi:hypothetical protein
MRHLLFTLSSAHAGLGAVAHLHGKRLLEPSDTLVRDDCLITHTVADFSLLQSGTHLAKQTGMLSGYIYANPLRVLKQPRNSDEVLLTSDEEDEPEIEPVAETRLRLGHVFYEHKGSNSAGMIVAAGIEEMFVYAGVAEEFSLKKPTLPNDAGHMRSAALLGYRFKRIKVGGVWQWAWRYGTEKDKALEKDAAEMTLSAVKVVHSTNLYVVEGDVASIFGSSLLTMFNEVLSSSTLFEAHREHGLLVGTDPLSTLRRMSRGTLARKIDEGLETLVTSVYATLLHSVAGTFSKTFEALKKASPSQVMETSKELMTAFLDYELFLRKHILWLLRRVEPTKLKGLLTNVQAKLPAIQTAARTKLAWPVRANALLQDEVPGGRETSGGGGGKAGSNGKAGSRGRLRKIAGGPDKEYSPTKDLEETPAGSGKAAKNLQSLLSSGEHYSANSPGTVDLATQLASQLSKMPSQEEHQELKSRVSALQQEQKKVEAERNGLRTSRDAVTLRSCAPMPPRRGRTRRRRAPTACRMSSPTCARAWTRAQLRPWRRRAARRKAPKCRRSSRKSTSYAIKSWYSQCWRGATRMPPRILQRRPLRMGEQRRVWRSLMLTLTLTLTLTLHRPHPHPNLALGMRG